MVATWAGAGIDAYWSADGALTRRVGSYPVDEFVGSVGYLDGDAVVYVVRDVSSLVVGSGDAGSNHGISVFERVGVLGAVPSVEMVCCAWVVGP